MSTAALLLTAAEDTAPVAGTARLIIAALVAIAVVVLLISWLKTHPMIALILGAATLGIIAGMPLEKLVKSFTDGFGKTTGSVGLLVALGAMIGKMLADSGGADSIVDAVIDRVPDRLLPWAMAVLAFVLGLPLFFEVGVVLLVPVVILVARRSGQSLLRLGIPALAGLSVLHGLVPPHPGPLVAIDAIKPSLGLTMILGILIAIPTVVISGPLLASLVIKMVPERSITGTVGGGLPGLNDEDDLSTEEGRQASVERRRAAAAELGATKKVKAFAALISILTPVLLMLARAVGELVLDEGKGVRPFLEAVGEPPVAMLAGVVAAMLALGVGSGMNKDQIGTSLGSALPGVAGILLIVAAGGGFKETLVNAGVGDVIGDLASDAHLSPLVLGWLVAVAIRLATGSATVATITAAGIVSPLAGSLDDPTKALLVLAIGCGSVFFSHVNDAGFWLVKEYFGLTVPQTLKSWSLMETVISVVGFAFVMLASVFI